MQHRPDIDAEDTTSAPCAKDFLVSDRGKRIGTATTPNEASYSRFMMNRGAASLVKLDGEDIIFPEGCLELAIQPRFCGDYYAEIKGVGFYVAGYGPRTIDAARMALGKVPA